MNLGRANTNSTKRESLQRTALIGGGVVIAAVIGFAVITGINGSNINPLAIGGIVSIAVVGFFAWALGLPVMGMVRFGFIASFFFKSDLTLYKIDEIEDPSGLNLSLALIFGSVLVLYDYFAENERERVFPASVSFLLTALFVCSTVSVVYGGATLLGGSSLLSLLTSILIAYATASHFGRRDRIVQLIVGIGCGVIFTGIAAFSQYTFDWPTNLPYLGTGTESEQSGTQSIELSRVPGFLRTPNGMGWVISCLVPLIMAPVICRVKGFTSNQRILLLAAAFAGIVGVILSLARGSWLGLVVAIAFMVIFGWFRLSSEERRSYFASVAGAIILTCTLLTPFSGRIYDRLTEDDRGAASVRIPLMENALRMIEDNPLTGIGLNQYRREMTRYDETGMFVSQEFPNPVHNVFAHVTTEIGIPGGIIFCLLLFIAFFECLWAMRTHDRLLFALGLGLSVALVAFAISGIKEPGSLGSVRPPMRTFFLLIGIAMALTRIRLLLTSNRYSPIQP